MGLRDQILEMDDRPYEDVEVEEWGGVVVRIRGLSAADSEAFARQYSDAGEGENMFAAILVRTMHDPETNERIFGDDDVAAVADKSSQVVTRESRKALALSGLGDIEEAKNE